MDPTRPDPNQYKMRSELILNKKFDILLDELKSLYDVQPDLALNDRYIPSCCTNRGLTGFVKTQFEQNVIF